MKRLISVYISMCQMLYSNNTEYPNLILISFKASVEVIEYKNV